MKITREQLMYIALAILLITAGLLMFRRNQEDVKKVENKIDTLSVELKRMNLLTRSIADNLQQTILLITNVSAHLEQSSRQLEGLLQEAGSISAREKEKIRTALNEIEITRTSVEAERQKALKLIGELNAAENGTP